MGNNITVPLPPNVIVRENPSIGVEFIYAEKEKTEVLITQHPYDNDSIRMLVWQLWKKHHAR